jgi:hypothetical protein
MHFGQSRFCPERGSSTELRFSQSPEICPFIRAHTELDSRARRPRTGAICESISSDSNGLRRHFRAAEPRTSAARAPSRRRSRGHFALGLDETEDQQKQRDSFRGAKRSVSRRGRKSLRSLTRAKWSFRGILCFQSLDSHFVSHETRAPLPAPVGGREAVLLLISEKQ